MESDPDVPMVYLHDESPEAIEAAPVARELTRLRLLKNKQGAAFQVLEDFRRFREGESDIQWQVRQGALIGCLTMVAAQALLTAYEDDDGERDQEGIDEFFAQLAETKTSL
jgi:hypothetical protein